MTTYRMTFKILGKTYTHIVRAVDAADAIKELGNEVQFDQGTATAVPVSDPRQEQALIMTATMIDAQRRANRPYLPTRADLDREAHAQEMARLRRMDGFITGVSVVGILTAVAAMVVVVIRNFI